MNNLVSKSPVLRFKLGKKIIKALGGVKTSAPINEAIGRYVREKNRSLFGSGWRWYDTLAPVGRDHVALNLEIEQDGWILKPNGTKIRASLRNKQAIIPNTPLQQVSNQTNTKQVKTRLFAPAKSTSITNNSSSSKPLYMFGKMGGWNRNMGDSITDLESLNYLKEMGLEGKNAGEILTLINQDLGSNSVKVDNKWGNLSRAGLKAYYEKWKATLPVLSSENPIVSGLKLQLNQEYLLENPQVLTDYNIVNNPNLKVNPDKYVSVGPYNNYKGSIALKDYGIRDYNSLVNYVKNNPNNFLSSDLTHAFGDVNNWNQQDFENTVGIRGHYGRLNRNSLWGYLAGLLNKWNSYKLGGLLISRNPITRFKQRKFYKSGPVTTLKTGGNILYLEKAGKFMNPLSWNLLMNNSIGNKFNKDRVLPAIELVKSITKPIELRMLKALKRNSHVSNLLLLLWNKGFFKGIKDRKGRDVTYNTAVDGILGRMTKAAIENAKAAGYDIDELGNLRTKIQVLNSINNDSIKTDSVVPQLRLSFLEALKGNLSRGLLSGKDSQKEGEEAIAEHKIRYNVNDPYLIFDKKNNLMKVKIKNKVLEQYPITLGRTIGDGLPSLETKYIGDAPGTSGAGVFTIGNIKPTSDYIGNEPIFLLYPDSVNLYIAQSLHSPAGYVRLKALKDPKASKRRLSGCFSGDCGVALHLYDDKIINLNDSAYVLPEVEGNRMIEKNGRILMEWGNNNPEYYTEKNGTLRKFRYNNKI